MTPSPNNPTDLANTEITDATSTGQPPPVAPTSPAASNRLSWLQWLGLGLIMASLAIVLIAAWQWQALSDWWRLRGYAPPAAISRLADQDTTTSYTRHLFYLNKPQLLNTVASFRNNCPENKNTIVLGCYHPGQNGIFIYNVSDPTLAGVQQVTAAHEVLHAVYARLSAHDRANVDNLLENYYHQDLHDPRVQAEIKLYQQIEPHDVMDEMDSTFGTEIADLPAPLEHYYQRYFTNRQAIVTYEQHYQAEFTQRMSTINTDDAQLDSLKQAIDNEQAILQTQLSELNAQRNHLTGLLAADNISQYDAGVGTYNNLVNTYNQGVSQLKTTINSYNQLVASRNQIAGQLTTLDQALDTRLTPQSTK